MPWRSRLSQDPQVADPDRLQPFLRSSVDNFDWSGHPHLQMLTVAGPFQAAGPGDTPSRRRIFTCRPDTPAAEARLRQPDRLDPGAPCLPPAGDRRGPAAHHEFLRIRPARRRLRSGNRTGAGADSRQPAICVPHRTRSRGGGSRRTSIESAISIWRRGSPSSYGAAFPTTSCSRWPSQAS